jgi:hypothetical protein
MDHAQEALRFADTLSQRVARARTSLKKYQEGMTREANKHRREKNFVAGDRVWLSTNGISSPSWKSAKFTPKFIGPFLVESAPHVNTVRLTMPPGCRLHPVVNVDRVKRAEGVKELSALPWKVTDLVEDTEPVWDIVGIVGHSAHSRRGQKFRVSFAWPHPSVHWLNQPLPACFDRWYGAQWFRDNKVTDLLRSYKTSRAYLNNPQGLGMVIPECLDGDQPQPPKPTDPVFPADPEDVVAPEQRYPNCTEQGGESF